MLHTTVFREAQTNICKRKVVYLEFCIGVFNQTLSEYVKMISVFAFAMCHTKAVCLFAFNLVKTENCIVVFNNKTFLFANIKSY